MTISQAAKYRKCKVLDCQQKRQAKGLCRQHYLKFHRYGDPLFIGKNCFTKEELHELNAQALKQLQNLKPFKVDKSINLKPYEVK